MSNKRHASSPLPPSFGYVPWLIQLNGSKKPTQNFINPSDGTIEERTVPMMEQKMCLGVYGEWLLLMDPKSRELTLWSLTRDQKVSLPRLLEPLESLGGPKDENWTKVQVKFDYFSKYCFRGDISICKGKLYALLSPKDYTYDPLRTIVIDVEDLLTGLFENTIITNPEYRVTYVEQFGITNHLLVSSDDVYLVSVYFFRGAVINIDMYILGTSEQYNFKQKCPELCWNSVSGIGRRTFFLSSNYSTSLSANYMQGSSIYILLEEDDVVLYKISLDNEIASFILSIPEQTDQENQLYWVVPSRSRSNKWANSRLSHSISSNESNAATIYKRKENTRNVSRSWADMPIELADLLCSRLNVVERIRFSSICKAWSYLPLHSMHDEKAWPLLMHYSKHSTSCRLYDPLYGYQYSCEIKELVSCKKIWSSNNGWILMSRSNQSACILNPFTGVVVDLPRNQLFEYKFWNSMTISSTGEVIAISYDWNNSNVNIYFWKPGMSSWIVDSIRVHYESFPISSSNLIFLNEKLYYLDVEGFLQIFDRKEKTMQIVDDWPEFECEDGYLLEYQGKILSVYLDDEPEHIYVYRLDKTDSGEHRWTKIEDIGDVMIFLNRQATFAIPSPLERCANRIYLPRFDGDESEHPNNWAFYCLGNRSYHPKFYGLKEPINCVWIKPNLQVKNIFSSKAICNS